MKMQVRLASLVVIALLCTGIGGCGQSREQIENAKLQQFLQKKRSPVVGVDYRVLPPDILSISSHNVSEINGITQQIRPDGKITLPLVGELFVAGMTPEEIRREVTTSVQRFYKKVDVTVFVSGYNSQKIFVFGEVGRPGPLPWTGTDTLLDVLAVTQPTLLAWPEKIKIIRAKQPRRGGYLPDDPEACEGSSDGDTNQENLDVRNKQGAQELTVDLASMVKTGDMSHNVLLQPDDVVYVPANPFAAVGMAIQQVMFPTRGVVDMIRTPGDVDSEYLYWKNRNKNQTQYINVRQTGGYGIGD